MEFATELRVAREAARLTSDYLKREYAAFEVIPNAPASISTHADRGAQEIILRHIRSHFPSDSLLAEEATETVLQAPVGQARLWVVDPIDGTRGFATKNGEFCVMVGLSVNGVPVLGVVVEPTTDRETYATLNSGCWIQDGGEAVRVQVSTTAKLSEAALIQSHANPDRPKKMVAKLQPATVIETYSAGIKLARVARGEADIYVNSYAGFHDWDACAGDILVREAGGKVTLFDGEPITYGRTEPKPRSGFVACNANIHAEAVERLG